MELGSVLEFVESRSILVTGAAGFIAKIFVEKILRVQPNVQKLYLLLKAADVISANLRFENEAIEKPLFHVLKEQHGGNFNKLISEKIQVVPGDITYENLGIKDSTLLEEMWKEVDVIINLAANTNFDERYDVSIGINTLGAKHVMNFSKQCGKLKVLVHVSTVYVCGEKEGLILETPIKMGETLNGTPGLDIDAEKKLIDETLEQLMTDDCTEETIKSVMKDLGIQRARKYGWPNTYVFTKAMGEMLMDEFKDNIPIVILRPSMVVSTYKDPFPGWIEGAKTIDGVLIGYSKGKLTTFLGCPETIFDVIPADMVVNAMIVAMVAQAGRPSQMIYHIGSSAENPLKYKMFQDYSQTYFIKNPLNDKKGRPIIVGKVKMLNSMDTFRRNIAIKYLLPLKVLKFLNTICCQNFQGVYLDRSRKIKYVLRLVELYRPYLLFQGRFDDMNMKRLRLATRESNKAEDNLFYFDPKILNWEDYFSKIHLPGLVKYVGKQVE